MAVDATKMVVIIIMIDVLMFFGATLVGIEGAEMLSGTRNLIEVNPDGSYNVSEDNLAEQAGVNGTMTGVEAGSTNVIMNGLRVGWGAIQALFRFITAPVTLLKLTGAPAMIQYAVGIPWFFAFCIGIMSIVRGVKV